MGTVQVHCFSGASECITGVFLFGFQRGAAGRAAVMALLLCFSMLHILTALSQCSIVFGVRKVMVPAYYTAVLMKLYAWARCASFFLDTDSAAMTEDTLLAFLSLVLLHHIYARASALSHTKHYNLKTNTSRDALSHT